MNKIFLSLIFFLNFIVGAESNPDKKTSEHIEKKQDEHIGNYLTLYKDRCLASTKLKLFPDKKKRTLRVPVSIDPQSLLFSQNGVGLPEYYLKKENDKSTETELDIVSNHDFDGDLNYSFSGISWHMHYVIEINNLFDEIVNFNGFISVDNQSGADFEKAQLRFIDAQTDSLAKGQSFQQYDVKQNYNILKKTVVRIPWVEMHKQKCSRDYCLDVGGENLKDLSGSEKIIPLQVWLKFKNKFAKEKGLAAGDIEIYIRDDESRLKYLGAAVLSGTVEEEFISLGLPPYLLSQLKSNRDSPLSKIKASLEQTEYKVLLTEKISEAAYRLTVRNFDDKEVTIKVVLPFGKNQGKVIRENMEHVQENENSIGWPLQVKPNSEVILRYRIQLMQKG